MGAARAGTSDVAERSPARCCPTLAGLELGSGLLWRGRDYSLAMTAQPWIESALGPLDLQAGAAWAVDGSWWGQDLSVGWTLDLSPVELTLIGAGYFFPEGEWGKSPVLELGLAGSGPPALPLRLYLGRNVVNDGAHGTYGEVGVAPTWPPLEAALFLGTVLNRSEYYEAGGGQAVNLGLSLDYAAPLSRSLALDLGATAIYNPARSRGWAVARVGVSVPLLPEPDGRTRDPTPFPHWARRPT